MDQYAEKWQTSGVIGDSVLSRTISKEENTLDFVSREIDTQKKTKNGMLQLN